MKEEFPGYFPPPVATIKTLWEEGLFVFDANFLLNLYRYSKDTRAEVLKILNAIEKQVWSPHQAALEFLKNRLQVINEQQETYDGAKKKLEAIAEDLEAPRRHPFVAESLLKQMMALFAKVRKELDDQKNEFAKFLESDPVLEEVARLFAGKIGAAFAEDRLQKIFADGERRYKEQIPPGFSDQKKEGRGKFGDLILWLQIVEKAKADKRPIIFVTGDSKDDWWRRSNGRTVGPRPELVAEFKVETGMDFHMYAPDRFLEFGRTHLGKKIEQSAIEEVKEVREKSQDLAKQAAAMSSGILANYAEQHDAWKRIAEMVQPAAAQKQAEAEAWLKFLAETFPSPEERLARWADPFRVLYSRQIPPIEGAPGMLLKAADAKPEGDKDHSQTGGLDSQRPNSGPEQESGESPSAAKES